MHRSIVAITPLIGATLAFQCESFYTNVTVSALSYLPAFPPFENHYETVAFLKGFTARNASTASPFKGAVNVTETFSISADFCWPSRSHHGPPHGGPPYGGPPNGEPLDVQVLTHGLGFDKSYWNFYGESSEYNYINAATGAGYATLSYDRIGNGLSSIPDPYSIQQAPIELAVLEQLTIKLRDGTLDSCIRQPVRKVFHVGHSFGSALSHGVAARSPGLSDGVILTGYAAITLGGGPFAINSGLHLAKENQPERFGNHSTGSLTWGDELANQYSFLTAPYFDPKVLAYAEAHKFPFSISEFLTQGLIETNATAFTGPVLLMAADTDLIFCQSDCVGIVDQLAPFFPAAAPFQTYVQPRTGHGMNLHYNATAMYGVVNKFLKDHA
ncbi:hypothetical protein LTR10_002344 [Elasticomyces elasticus]|nr:hypothetical protein LTR10_002344 [Elasticomyces elasticus]KAK4973587.1 hypothetical protein LTR42_005576 [Elasticomyces elasticus]